jgi:hypothetical protein
VILITVLTFYFHSTRVAEVPLPDALAFWRRVAYETAVSNRQHGKRCQGEPESSPRSDMGVTVFVVRDGNHYAVNDVFYPRVYADPSIPHYPTVEETRLSQLLDNGCKDGKWVGYPDN